MTINKKNDYLDLHFKAIEEIIKNGTIIVPTATLNLTVATKFLTFLKLPVMRWVPFLNM